MEATKRKAKSEEEEEESTHLGRLRRKTKRERARESESARRWREPDKHACVSESVCVSSVSSLFSTGVPSVAHIISRNTTPN